MESRTWIALLALLAVLIYAGTVLAQRSAMITICHISPGAAAQTITVAKTALPAHQAHGDTLGACPASPHS
jgi:hypothetical protein